MERAPADSQNLRGLGFASAGFFQGLPDELALHFGQGHSGELRGGIGCAVGGVQEGRQVGGFNPVLFI